MLSDIQYIGIVGVSLYGLLFFVAIRRLHYFCYPYTYPYFTTRKIFHTLMVLYSVLQCISYVNFIYIENYSSWNYACHVLAIFCEISSFSLVAILWSKSLLSSHNAYGRVIPFLLVVDLIFLTYVFAVVIDMLTTKHSFNEWAENSVLYSTMLLLEPCTILINAMMIIYLGVRIYNKLSVHTSFRSLPMYRKQDILFKLIGTMVLCCLCFICRGILELLLYFNGAKEITIDAWYLANFFVSLLPACLLLYTMRRTKHLSSVQHRYSADDVDTSKINTMFKKIREALYNDSKVDQHLSKKSNIFNSQSIPVNAVKISQEDPNEFTQALLHGSEESSVDNNLDLPDPSPKSTNTDDMFYDQNAINSQNSTRIVRNSRLSHNTVQTASMTQSGTSYSYEGTDFTIQSSIERNSNYNTDDDEDFQLDIIGYDIND